MPNLILPLQVFAYELCFQMEIELKAVGLETECLSPEEYRSMTTPEDACFVRIPFRYEDFQSTINDVVNRIVGPAAKHLVCSIRDSCRRREMGTLLFRQLERPPGDFAIATDPQTGISGRVWIVSQPQAAIRILPASAMQFDVAYKQRQWYRGTE